MNSPHPPPDPTPPPDNDVQIIAPHEAAAILNPYLEQLETEGWLILVQTDYMARLTRDQRNLDVRVDLLGEIQTEEKPLSLVQESGRLIGIMLVGVFTFMLVVIADILGLLNF